jgi:site-specific recombinase XerD
MQRLDVVHRITDGQRNKATEQAPLWRWSRTTAWTHVKTIMRAARIAEERAMPKALRHAFGVGGTQAGIPLYLIQRWLGHADIQTTAIYTNVMGDEERALADRMWS